MGLLKILAIFLLVFYGVKFLFRLLMPFALRKLSERVMGGNNPYEEFKQQGSPKQEGELRVDYIPQEDHKAKKGTETAGEFIDFEEIK